MVTFNFSHVTIVSVNSYKIHCGRTGVSIIYISRVLYKYKLALPLTIMGLHFLPMKILIRYQAWVLHLILC